MDDIYVYEADICKLGTADVIKKLHVASNNTFNATHMLYHFIEDNSEFKQPVEIGSIHRLIEISDLLIDFSMFEDDDEGEYTGKEPLEMAENMPDDQILKFKCSCGEELRVADGNWPYVVCPKCDNNIKRKDIENIGGIYLFTGDDNSKKKKKD